MNPPPSTTATTFPCLPPFLVERTRLLGGMQGGSDAVNREGAFVFYWMRTALRAEQNPALDVAIELANHYRRPLWVYHALTEKYRYASDRHHTFVLQAACDLQAQLAERGIAYAFHLERSGHRGPHLRALAQQALAVVTEEMPVDPLRRWTERLAGGLKSPLLAVDTACVVPMQRLGKAYDRAYQFRQATAELYAQRIARPYQASTLDSGNGLPAELPFIPVDLPPQANDCGRLAELVSDCDIDHSIGPVPHTIGGSSAGYQRWQAFRASGLNRYARQRNDATHDGVSRMSAYLHYGMVSPFRLAREAAATAGEGAEKFLDELLIWRELAYAFCFHRPDHARWSGLPGWARQSLLAHAGDSRPALHSWETLARGRTGDALWDAAQRSLLQHGELHNNVRMTWGKALLNWTRHPREALRMIIDLNHRYALDGRDPASYGGILWCLGQFDRPFAPEQPIFGTVRTRPTSHHARRIDLQAYAAKASRPLVDPVPRVAVVGAGLSGLLLARTLTDHGIAVTVLEKSRGPSGRMSTRRAPADTQFDHGAQYFTARGKTFRRYVAAWQQAGIVQPWRGQVVSLHRDGTIEAKNGTRRFVGVPGMNAIGKHLAGDLDVRYRTQVQAVVGEGEHWRLTTTAGEALSGWDAVVMATPAAQAAELLRPVAADLAASAQRAEMAGCWALMLELENRLELPFDGAFVQDSPISWVARNNSKPGRPPAETWVIHASPEWTEQHRQDGSEAVREVLLRGFFEAVGLPAVRPRQAVVHRWRFALPTRPLEQPYLFDATSRLGACGDWCGGPRVEGAFYSGIAMAGRLMGAFMTPKACPAPDVVARNGWPMGDQPTLF